MSPAYARALAMLAGVTALGWLGEPTGLQVRPWLETAGVRTLAVVFLPDSCPGCADAEARWAKWARRHRALGLRVVAVVTKRGGRCPETDWADDQVCDGGVVFAGYDAPKGRPTAVVWDWRGAVVAQPDLRQARRALRRPWTEARVVTKGRDRVALAQALRSAVTGTGKLRVGDGADSGTDGLAASECGSPPADRTPLVLEARVSRGRLVAGLLDSKRRCVAARVNVGATGRRLEEAAVEAVGRLIYALMRDPEAPNLGPVTPRAPVPSTRLAPGQLIDPRASAAPEARPPAVARPVEAFSPPARVAPGRLVDPHAAGRISLEEFVARWKGTRFRQGGRTREAIDAPHLAYELYKAVYGMDLTPNLHRQLASGPEVAFDPANPQRDLLPGDLLFFVSYAYLPRSVSVYIGGGKVVQSALIRGVVVDPVPRSVPEYLYLVARRPLAGSPDPGIR